MQVQSTIEITRIKEIATGVAQRAFCYDTPSDFRAGVEALTRSLETILAEGKARTGEDAQANPVPRAG